MSTTQVSDAMRVTTSLDATKLTGNLPAISGASLTGVVGKIVQVVNVIDSAVATGTTILPSDDTIPQNTEGIEVMTLAITPTSATNKLLIEVFVNMGVNIGGERRGVALFQDSTAGALGASADYESGGNEPIPLSMNHYMTSGTVSETTFKVRIGISAAATVTFNGHSSGRINGGVMSSSITITEIAV